MDGTLRKLQKQYQADPGIDAARPYISALERAVPYVAPSDTDNLDTVLALLDAHRESTYEILVKLQKNEKLKNYVHRFVSQVQLAEHSGGGLVYNKAGFVAMDNNRHRHYSIKQKKLKDNNNRELLDHFPSLNAKKVESALEAAITGSEMYKQMLSSKK